MMNLTLTDGELRFVNSIIQRIDKGDLKGVGTELLADFQLGLTEEVIRKGFNLGDVLCHADMAALLNKAFQDEKKTILHWIAVGYTLAQEGKQR